MSFKFPRYGRSQWNIKLFDVNTNRKNNVKLGICPYISFTYKQVQSKGIDKCIEKIKKVIKEEGAENNDDLLYYHEADWQELRTCFEEFIKKVDNEPDWKETMYRKKVVDKE